MRYVEIEAKEVPVVPDFFQELEDRTRSKVIKQYINNVIKKHYVFDNKQPLESYKDAPEDVLKSLEANKLKNLVRELIKKKNKILEQKFLRGDNDAISYKMFPEDLFSGIPFNFVSSCIKSLKKYFVENKIKLNDTLIEKINKVLKKDKFTRRFVKDNYTQNELYTLYILYKFKTLNVIDLQEDSIFTYNFSFQEKDKLLHIIDYLNAQLEVNDTPNWKEELKEKEQDLKQKLNNISFNDLQQEVENWNFTDDNVKNKTLKQEIKDKDVKLIYTYTSGYSWVSVISEDGLDREGSNMNHCVGGDSYCQAVKDGSTIIYSLRDKNNKPHITIEVTKGKLIQIQGFGNSIVSEKYHDYLLDGIKNHISIDTVENTNYLTNNGILYKEGDFFSIYDLPDNFNYGGIIVLDSTRKFELKNLKCETLEIKSCPKLSIKGFIKTNRLNLDTEESLFQIMESLDKIKFHFGYIFTYYVDIVQEDLNYLENQIPQEIKQIIVKNNIYVNKFKQKSVKIPKVDGDVHLIASKVQSFPKELTINGNFEVNQLETPLPEKLIVNGHVRLNHLKTELPKVLKVTGDLDIANSKIDSLPEGLEVGGDLILESSEIQTLSKKMKIGRSINLFNSKIDSLPNGLKVKGGLDLSQSSIQELPKKLQVRGRLKLKSTHISSLPKDLSVEGDIILDNSSITSIPKGFIVHGSLSLDSTPIKSLPEGLVVGDMLSICRTDIKELPNDIKIDSLRADNSSLTKLPKKFKIKHSLYLRDMHNIELPDELEVGGTLNLMQSSINNVPKRLVVGRGLNLFGSNIKRLPESLKVDGDLDISRTEIKELPKNLKIGGDLELFLTNIQELPDGLEVGGSIDIQHTNITKISNIIVKGGLHAANSKLKEFSEKLNVGKNLDISQTAVTKLPKNLIIGGNLLLKESNVKFLPEGLSVKGNLDIASTPITVLPKNLKVFGTLNMAGSNVQKISEGLVVGSDFSMWNCNVTTLPKNLIVGGNLYLENSKVTALPEGLKVLHGSVFAKNTNISKLSNNITVGESLILEGTKIKSIPPDLKVGTYLDIRNTRVTHIPKGLEVKQVIK